MEDMAKIGRPKKSAQERTRPLTVMLRPEVRKHADQLASVEGISLGGLITKLVENEFNRQHPDLNSAK